MAASWRRWTLTLAFASTFGSSPARAQSMATDPTVVVSPVEGPATFAKIRPEGSRVAQGDVVCELDPGRERENQATVVRGADAAYQQARATREIAEIAVEEYVEGPNVGGQELPTLEAEVALAESLLKRAQGRADWAEQMFAKRFLSASQLLSEKFALEHAKRSYEQARLNQFEYEKGLAQGERGELSIWFAEQRRQRAKDRQRWAESFRTGPPEGRGPVPGRDFELPFPKRARELVAALEQAREDEQRKRAVSEREQARLNEQKADTKPVRLVAPCEGVVRYGRPEGGSITVDKNEVVFRVVNEVSSR